MFKGFGWVIVVNSVVEQPLASMTVTEIVPADKLLAVIEDCVNGSFHE